MQELEQNAWNHALLVSKHTEDFKKAFHQYLVSLDDLEEGSFWQLHHVFVRFLRRQAMYLTVHIGMFAAKEFFQVSQSRPIDDSTIWYTASEAQQFVNTWRKKQRDIEIAMSRLGGLDPTFAVGILIAGESVIKDLYDHDFYFSVSLPEEKLLNVFAKHIEKENWENNTYELLMKGNTFDINESLANAAADSFCFEKRSSSSDKH